MTQDTFQGWLTREIREILDRKPPVPPLLLWFDPDRQWLDLLRAAAKVDGFDLWADPDEHELVTRDRFHRSERAARVVWLPVARDGIGWFKPFELEAEAIWEKSLLDALREYGVHIPRDHESELASLLPAHAREWFDKSKETWKELTPANAKGALVDDHRMLQVVAGPLGEFQTLRDEERFEIFARRATEDFGLPNPTGQGEHAWRVTATARLLATEAAEKCPQEPPREGDNIIPAGLARKRAMDLMRAWQHHVQYIPTFEELVPKADATIGLSHWAKSLTTPPKSHGSLAVEETIFDQFVDRLDRVEEVDLLAQELYRNQQTYQDRDNGFWGRLATHKVGWHHMIELANAASLLVENASVSDSWKNSMEAVDWYQSRGWHLDQAGEQLFIESVDIPAKLHRIRARLQRGYLRATDRIGRTYSELLVGSPDKVLSLPTAGELALSELQRQKVPTALVFLDACRLDLGQRLAAMLNEKEPAQRATVGIAKAPVPSITALGMPMALPMACESLKVTMSADGKDFVVQAEGFDGNLVVAEERRRWLTEKMEVKQCLTIEEVLSGDPLKPATKTRRLIAVHGKEFDQHDGSLQLTGTDNHLRRYVQAIRRLRDAGYNRVIVLTDHGFFHWRPEEGEAEEPKPEGQLLWSSRRAMVGSQLVHAHAVRLPVPCSHLEAMVPRSVNAFRTYGKLGFFHGGATLQEMIIPVVVATWPAKATKVQVVLKPVQHIATESPRVQVQAGVSGQARLFGAESNVLARRAMVIVKEPESGKLVFKHADAVTVEPGGESITVQLKVVEPKPELPYGTQLEILVRDADDEEILAREEVTLKVEINEW